MRREWLGPEDEMESVTVYYPVLLVHDARLDSPGVVAFLNDDFMDLLGKQPDGIRVAPLIVLSIADLESLESSVGPFSLMEIIEEYDRRCPRPVGSLSDVPRRVPFRDGDPPEPTRHEGGGGADGRDGLCPVPASPGWP